MQQEHIEIQLPSRLWYIEPILALLKQLAQQLGFCQQRIADIQLAIDEICGNAIEHGSEGGDTGIAITLVLDERHLNILVKDKGSDGESSWLTAERLKEIYQRRAPDRERGHGIYMAEQLSDELKMEPNSSGGTDVRIRFSLPSEKMRSQDASSADRSPR